MNDSENENDLLNGPVDQVEVHADAWEDDEVPEVHVNPFQTVRRPAAVATAIQNGIAQMMNTDADMRGDSPPLPEYEDEPPVQPEEQLVNAFSEESSMENAEEEPSSGAGGYSLPVALRRARKSEEEKKRQDNLRKLLMEGCSPAKFCDALNTATFVRTEMTKDTAAETFVNAVTKIGRDLDKINKAYLTELNPFQNAGTMVGFELALAVANSKLLEHMLALPPGFEYSRWRIELTYCRSMTNPTIDGITLRLFFTARTWDTSGDFYLEKGKNFNPEWVVEKNMAAIDKVFTKAGCKGLNPTPIPKALLEHERWGQYIKDLVSPWRNLRKIMKEMKRTLSDMAKKSLSDLVTLNEDEKLACSLCGLWGTPDVQNNVAVILTPQGTLKAFNLDPKKKSATDCQLPAWARDCFVTMHRSIQKQHAPKKRGRNEPGPSGNNNNYRGNYKRRRSNTNH